MLVDGPGCSYVGVEILSCVSIFLRLLLIYICCLNILSEKLIPKDDITARRLCASEAPNYAGRWTRTSRRAMIDTLYSHIEQNKDN